MMLSFSKIGFVARAELHDALRSRRFVLMLALYILGAGGACFGLITALHRVEVELSNALGLTAAASPGAVADALWQSVTFQRMVRELVGNEQVGQELLGVAPIALIYGWLAFTFTPILILLSTPSRIAEEVASGYARFSVVRVTRTEWCLGKYLGQALEVMIPLLLSAVSAWGVARFRLQSLAGADVIGAMLMYGLKVWVYCMAFVGLGLGVSQVCRSPNQAVVLALLLWTGLSIIRGASQWVSAPIWKQVLDSVSVFAPATQRLDMWRTNPVYYVPAMIYSITLGLVYFSLGHWCFLRKDL